MAEKKCCSSVFIMFWLNWFPSTSICITYNIENNILVPYVMVGRCVQRPTAISGAKLLMPQKICVSVRVCHINYQYWLIPFIISYFGALGILLSFCFRFNDLEIFYSPSTWSKQGSRDWQWVKPCCCWIVPCQQQQKFYSVYIYILSIWIP